MYYIVSVMNLFDGQLSYREASDMPFWELQEIARAKEKLMLEIIEERRKAERAQAAKDARGFQGRRATM